MTTEILLSIAYVVLLAGTFLAIGRVTVPRRERLPLQNAQDVSTTIRRGLWTVYRFGAAYTFPVRTARCESVTPAA